MSDPADRLREIANAIQHAKILLAGAQLRVFDQLRGSGRAAGPGLRSTGCLTLGTTSGGR